MANTEPNSSDYSCCIKVEFDGFSKNFFNKHDLFIEIKSKKEDKSLRNHFNNFIELDFVNTRLVLWKIKVYANNNQKIFDLIKLESGDYVFRKDGNFFKNDSLYTYLVKKMQVEDIGNFSSDVNQLIFDKLIKN